MNRNSKRLAGREKQDHAARTAGDIAIEDALKQVRATTEAANNAAIHLNTQILNFRSSLASDAAIVRDAATLLAHVAQNFSRTAAAASIQAT